jgi:hypothetical protein
LEGVSRSDILKSNQPDKFTDSRLTFPSECEILIMSST